MRGLTEIVKMNEKADKSSKVVVYTGQRVVEVLATAVGIFFFAVV